MNRFNDKEVVLVFLRKLHERLGAGQYGFDEVIIDEVIGNIEANWVVGEDPITYRAFFFKFVEVVVYALVFAVVASGFAMVVAPSFLEWFVNNESYVRYVCSVLQ